MCNEIVQALLDKVLEIKHAYVGKHISKDDCEMIKDELQHDFLNMLNHFQINEQLYAINNSTVELLKMWEEERKSPDIYDDIPIVTRKISYLALIAANSVLYHYLHGDVQKNI